MSRIHRAYRALITSAAFGCIAVACADEADPASLVEATQAVEGAEAADDGEGAMSDEAFEALMASATWREPTDEDREAWRRAAEHIERDPSDVPPPEAFVGAPRPEPDPNATCTTGERPEDREAEAARAAAEAAAPRELEPYVFPTPADPTRVTVPASVRGGPLVISPPDAEMAALVQDFRRSGCADDAMDDVPRCINHPYRVAQRAAAERSPDEALEAAFAYAERWEEETAEVRGVER